MTIDARALSIHSAANRDSSRIVFDKRRAVACLTIDLGTQRISVIIVELIDNIDDVFGFGTADRGLAIGVALTRKHSALHGKS